MLQETDLRTPCAFDEVTTGGMHKHRCECGTTWKHEGLRLQEECTAAEFKLAHSCPSCGNDVREKHYVKGDERSIDDPLGLLLASLLGVSASDIYDGCC